MRKNKLSVSSISLKKRTLLLVLGGNGSGNDPGSKTREIVKAAQPAYAEALHDDKNKYIEL
ncbi:hypothetical protein ACSLBF_10430 [Pseudoalteromonas sp. T1lg65]|uniref:hypothetical protein n=1 Tax=Pseudoalteromonas sp. T1lg65 TaxID=2077101 RepID=UPI003F799036